MLIIVIQRAAVRWWLNINVLSTEGSAAIRKLPLCKEFICDSLPLLFTVRNLYTMKHKMYTACIFCGHAINCTYVHKNHFTEINPIYKFNTALICQQFSDGRVDLQLNVCHCSWLRSNRNQVQLCRRKLRQHSLTNVQ